jgi:glycerol-3-phosphate O-acyltransferase
MRVPKAIRQFVERPRLPRLEPYVPKGSDPAIFWFNGERDDIIREVAERVAADHGRSVGSLELALNDCAMTEMRRLDSQRDDEARRDLGQWRSLARQIARMSEGEQRKAVREVTLRFAEDVAGNFDPRVYRMAIRAVPRLLASLMQPSKLPRALTEGQSVLDRLFGVEGNAEKLQRLEQVGSLVYVPTHSSNLDSIVLGRALEQVGLSPVVYGAGKNLFTNPIISFFMHNLGAYRVDRRINAGLYKEVLKTYSQVMIERGYHSLFFPGGTRSRSNQIENKLKLGLMGSALSAFAHNQTRGVDRRVFFVPTTINYALVLEAETLVEDWLKAEGRARYIIEDDEFSRLDRWVAFLRKVLGMQAACVIRFGDPVDPFGNPVDDEGHSIAPGGQTIDPASYVRRRGRATLDDARDAAYTRDLGEVLVRRFRHETVLMSTALVAHVLWRRIVEHSPGADLFSRLRMRGEVTMSKEDVVAQVADLRDRLAGLQAKGKVRLNGWLAEAEPEAIVSRALRVWNGYHDRMAAKDVGKEIVAEDPTLLLYYQNRLVPFATRVAGEHARAAREIAQLGLVTCRADPHDPRAGGAALGRRGRRRRLRPGARQGAAPGGSQGAALEPP